MVSKTYRNDGLEGRPTTIATGVLWYIDPANLTAQGVQDYMSRYTPFNSLFVRNNDTASEIEIYPNFSTARKIALPPGATVTVLNEPFNFLVIKNMSAGTISQSNITVKFEKIKVEK